MNKTDHGGYNVVDPLVVLAKENPDAPALRGPRVEGRIELTRADLIAGAALASERFRQAGLEQGDRIVLVCPTCPEFLLEFFGAQACGLTVVAANPLSTARELEYFITDSGARMVLSHPGCSEASQAAAEQTSVTHQLIEPLTTVSAEAFPETHEFSPVRRDSDEVAALLYTSGTTGAPKGAMLTVGNLLTAGRVGGEVSGATSSDRFGTALPLFHVFGLASVSLVALSAGASLTLLPRFDAETLYETMLADELTAVAGVPTMWNALLQVETDRQPTSLRLALSGGASMAVEVMRKFTTRFGATIAEGYGLTETTAFGTFNPWDGRIVPGSVGPEVPTLDVAVKDLDGQLCADNEVGEICIRGDLVMKGYWNNPSATNAAFDEEGFFHTGDLGYRDEDGYVFIVDRMKEMIIHGGYNVYPREVEEVLYEHPDVLEAAVIGTPDEHYGQIVTAVVAPLPGTTLTAEVIEAYCRESLAAYKVPRIIRFVDALPKGATGKIRKLDIDVSDASDAPAAPASDRTTSRS